MTEVLKRNLQTWRKSRSRGELIIAPLGATAALVMVATLILGVWWTWREQDQALHEQRMEQVRSLGDVLLNAASVMLANGEVGSLRHLVAQSALAYELSECRVTLGGAMVIAEADGKQINVQTLPGKWGGAGDGDDSMPEETLRGQEFSISYAGRVSERGPIVVEITASLREHKSATHTLAGLGAIGAAGLVSMLVMYRYTRTRAEGLGVIRDALRALADPATPIAAAMVSDDYGVEAQTWNRLLSEKEMLSQQVLARQAESMLGSRGESTAELRAACDALWQGLLVVDDKLRVQYANGAAAAFLQTPREKLGTGDLTTLKVPENVVNVVREVVTGANPGRRTIEIERTENGTQVVMRYTVRPIRSGDAASALVVMEDTTQQRVADAARHSFIAQATHELRMPLTNIRLYLETALNEGENDPKLRGECLNVANQEGRRLERMVSDMLSVAEIEAGSLKITRDDVRLDALFKELEGDYKAQAKEKQIALVFNLPPKLPVIQGDRGKLTLALHNLIGNAVKYTPADGRGKVTVNVDVRTNQLAIEVRDNGIGVAPDDAERIFEKFYRGKDKRVAKVTGSGLGLALAREIARLHGGDITLESELDKGSVFTLTLPAHVEPV